MKMIWFAKAQICALYSEQETGGAAAEMSSRHYTWTAMCCTVECQFWRNVVPNSLRVSKVDGSPLDLTKCGYQTIHAL